LAEAPSQAVGNSSSTYCGRKSSRQLIGNGILILRHGGLEVRLTYCLSCSVSTTEIGCQKFVLEGQPPSYLVPGTNRRPQQPMGSSGILVLAITKLLAKQGPFRALIFVPDERLHQRISTGFQDCERKHRPFLFSSLNFRVTPLNLLSYLQSSIFRPFRRRS
jgi:hypothetical protein